MRSWCVDGLRIGPATAVTFAPCWEQRVRLDAVSREAIDAYTSAAPDEMHLYNLAFYFVFFFSFLPVLRDTTFDDFCNL